MRLVLHFENVAIVFCRPPTFVLERLLSCAKTALIPKGGSFKILSRSIYTSFYD